MSNFYCEKCGIAIIDSDQGYVTGCEHYPPDIKERNMKEKDYQVLQDIKRGKKSNKRRR